VQAPSLRQAVSLTAHLRAIADQVWVHPSPSQRPGRREWIVAFTTPPMPLTLALIQSWEEAMLAVEHRWPGCHFLGWRTRRARKESAGSVVGRPGDGAADASQRHTQRELVVASLLRCPTDERRGIVHGRAVPR